jgi:hypothetical protein
MKKSLLLVAILITSFATSCKKELSELELAQQQLKQAEALYAKNDFTAAKLHIDSLNNLYPKQVDLRKKARTILYNIELTEAKRKLIFADSMYQVVKPVVDSVAKPFKFEKDTAYETLGNYIHKTQITESKLGNNFIKAYVNENGKFYLSSRYCSKSPINHQSAKFSIGDIYVETPVITDDGYTHYYKDEDIYHESVIYKDSATNKSIVQFVNENEGKTISVTLSGEKKSSKFYLSKNEEKAMKEAYNLSIYVTELKKFERMIDVSKKKIILLDEYLRVDKEENLNSKP